MTISDRLTRGFSATEMPDDLRQRGTQDPDQPGAREVQDPHEWEDPGPGILERIFPDTTAGWIAASAFVLIFGAVLYYLAPIFLGVATNPWVIVALILIGSYLATYLKGREDGINTYIGLDKSIIYYGSDADVRLGESGGVEGRSQVFRPYRYLGYGGFRKSFLRHKDLPFSAEKLRSKGGADATGKQPVRDRLNRSTVTADTDTVGTVHVTHAADLEYDHHGQATDRYALPPETIDEDVANRFRMQLQELYSQLKQHRQQIDLLKQSNKQLRDLKQQETVPQLEQTMSLIEDMVEMQRQTRAAPRRDQGGGQRTDTVKQIAERAQENLDNGK